MILVVDFETTGLFDKTLSNDHASQPRVVEMAWQVLDTDFNLIGGASTLVNPGNAASGPGATSVHGIPDEMLQTYGVPPLAAFHLLKSHLDTVSMLVSYNLSFELRMAEREMDILRQSKDWLRRPRLRQLDLMQVCSDLFSPGKWMKFSAAYEIVTGLPLQQKHRAAADVEATVEVLYKLVKAEKVRL